MAAGQRAAGAPSELPELERRRHWRPAGHNAGIEWYHQAPARREAGYAGRQATRCATAVPVGDVVAIRRCASALRTSRIRRQGCRLEEARGLRKESPWRTWDYMLRTDENMPVPRRDGRDLARRDRD